MSFLNLPVFVFGSLFVSVPIVLHLLMRSKPRHLLFPAVRFVQRRQLTNQRRFVLKHWALLTLRCLAVAGLAFTLARPTALTNALGNGFLLGGLGVVTLVVATLAVLAWQQRLSVFLIAALVALSALLGLGFAAAAWTSQGNLAARLLPDEEAPVAAVLLFDTSARMGYRHANQTRLEAAQELGLWLLKQLPQDSEIAVMETAVGSSMFAVDRAAAATAIKGLQPSYRAQPFPVALQGALELLGTSDLERRELYLFSDLTQASWITDDTSGLAAAWQRSPPSLLYVLDVGIREPRNLSLGLPELSAAHLAGGGSLRLGTRLLSENMSGDRELELLIERRDPTRPVIVDGQPLLPELTLRDKRTVAADNLTAAWAEFVIRGLDPGLHHGQIRIAGTDGLDIDNVRYFTVQVAEPWRVLVAAPPSATAHFLVDALSPFGAGDARQPLFQCDVMWLDELPAATLADYAAVALLDPHRLSPATCEKLANFVNAGGGLAVFLGRNAELTALNQPAVQALLPGTLARQGRSGPQDLYLSLGQADHPILRVFRPRATAIPWNDFPVYRYWVFDELQPEAAIVMRFGNGLPAIVERHAGRGRVLTMATPVSDALQVPGRPPWNLLPTAPDSWPYFVLVNEMFKYLVHGGASRLNYEVGQAAQIAANAVSPQSRYQLFTPQGTWQQLTVTGDRLTVRFTDVPGAYRLRSAQAGEEQLGFAVNLRPEVTRLQRIEENRLDDVLGKENYQLARDRAQIDRGISEARVGRELYPWTMLMTVLVLGLEHLLANRFYAAAVKPLK